MPWESVNQVWVDKNWGTRVKRSPELVSVSLRKWKFLVNKQEGDGQEKEEILYWMFCVQLVQNTLQESFECADVMKQNVQIGFKVHFCNSSLTIAKDVLNCAKAGGKHCSSWRVLENLPFKQLFRWIAGVALCPPFSDLLYLHWLWRRLKQLSWHWWRSTKSYWGKF